MIYQGMVIRAAASLKDSVFEASTILITEVNVKGAIGFVVNQPYGRSLNELEEFSHCVNIPLYDGGPVEDENIYFIHQRPDLVEGGTLVLRGIYVGGDFEEAVTHLNDRSMAANHLKIFVGYCGWNSGELEAEIAEGSWELVGSLEDEALKQVIFI
jgi:putative transcriptional regulator